MIENITDQKLRQIAKLLQRYMGFDHYQMGQDGFYGSGIQFPNINNVGHVSFWVGNTDLQYADAEELAVELYKVMAHRYVTDRKRIKERGYVEIFIDDLYGFADEYVGTPWDFAKMGYIG